MVFSGGILTFLEHMGFHEGLAPFFSACEAKPTISSMRPRWSDTGSKGLHRVLAAHVQEECFYRPKRFPSVSASVEGRIGWVSLYQNHTNASAPPCLKNKGTQSLIDERGTPDKMRAAPAAECPVKLRAIVWVSRAVSSAQVCFIKPSNLSLLLARVPCSLIFSPVSPGLI